MTKNNRKYYTAANISLLFSFAVAPLPYKLEVWDWIISLFINCVVYILFSLVIFNNKQPKPLTDLFLLFYLFFLSAKYIYNYNNYIKTYHSGILQWGNIILTIGLIIIFCSMGRIKSEKFIYPFAILVLLMIAATIILNIKNFSAANLYRRTPTLKNLDFFNITLFDYIIPLNVLVNEKDKNIKKSAISSVFWSFILVLIIIVLNFGCLKGDLLYSISPLQSLFRISTGNIVRNFDALFNYCLYFAYATGILLICCAYMKIKERFLLVGKSDLLLIFPFLFLISDTGYERMFFLQLIMVIIIFFGKEKVV